MYKTKTRRSHEKLFHVHREHGRIAEPKPTYTCDPEVHFLLLGGLSNRNYTVLAWLQICAKKIKHFSKMILSKTTNAVRVKYIVRHSQDCWYMFSVKCVTMCRKGHESQKILTCTSNQGPRFSHVGLPQHKKKASKKKMTTTNKFLLTLNPILTPFVSTILIPTLTLPNPNTVPNTHTSKHTKRRCSTRGRGYWGHSSDS